MSDSESEELKHVGYDSVGLSVEPGDVRIRSLTYEEFSKKFHLPINEAAKELGVCVTVLKKHCRKNGVTRWPHRKLKSIDKLVEKLESECASAPDKEYYRNEILLLQQKKELFLKSQQQQWLASQNKNKNETDTTTEWKNNPDLSFKELSSLAVGGTVKTPAPVDGNPDPYFQPQQQQQPKQQQHHHPHYHHHHRQSYPNQPQDNNRDRLFGHEERSKEQGPEARKFYEQHGGNTFYHGMNISYPMDPSPMEHHLSMYSNKYGPLPPPPLPPSLTQFPTYGRNPGIAPHIPPSMYRQIPRELLMSLPPGFDINSLPCPCEACVSQIVASYSRYFQGAGYPSPYRPIPSPPLHPLSGEGAAADYYSYMNVPPTPPIPLLPPPNAYSKAEQPEYRHFRKSMQAGGGQSNAADRNLTSASRNPVNQNQDNFAVNEASREQKINSVVQSTRDPDTESKKLSHQFGQLSEPMLPGRLIELPRLKTTTENASLNNEKKPTPIEVGGDKFPNNLMNGNGHANAPSNSKTDGSPKSDLEQNNETNKISSKESDNQTGSKGQHIREQDGIVQQQKRKRSEVGVSANSGYTLRDIAETADKSVVNDPPSPQNRSLVKKKRFHSKMDHGIVEAGGHLSNLDLGKVCDTLQSMVYSTDTELRFETVNGPKMLLFHGERPEIGTSIFDQKYSHISLEPYLEARKGRRVQRVFSVDGVRHLQLFGPLCSKRGDIIGTTGLCTQISDEN